MEVSYPVTLDDQRRQADLSCAEVARRANVSMPKVWRALRAGSMLKSSEIARIESVLSAALRERERVG